MPAKSIRKRSFTKGSRPSDGGALLAYPRVSKGDHQDDTLQTKALEAANRRRLFEEGRKIRQHFRPEPGTTVYSTGEKFPGMRMVVVGAFADPTFLPPMTSVFEASKHAWVTPPSGIAHYAQGRAPAALRAET